MATDWNKLPVVKRVYHACVLASGENPRLFETQIVRILPSGWRTSTGWLIQEKHFRDYHDTPKQAWEKYLASLSQRVQKLESQLVSCAAYEAVAQNELAKL